MALRFVSKLKKFNLQQLKLQSEVTQRAKDYIENIPVHSTQVEQKTVLNKRTTETIPEFQPIDCDLSKVPVPNRIEFLKQIVAKLEQNVRERSDAVL